MDAPSVKCAVCGTDTIPHEIRPFSMVSHPVDDFIRAAVPEIGPDAPVCNRCRSLYRRKYVESALTEEKGELSSLENAVVESLSKEETIARNVDAMYNERLSVGQRLADRMAAFGGSWTFIIIFGSILVIWIAVNSFLLMARPFDPYPFILLNLVLSCLAAIQAPVIMMSQNRQEAKDRLRAEQDYQVNLKAEIEIQHLNLKIDQLLQHQWQRLLEIQRLQLEVLDELEDGRNGATSAQK
ncbi:hypothetical protein C3F09_00530 [candidate division GN15 bacterium]|uniref:DUF1003 domain-containing protein n=1 Tax=candidate division GN15 bacterium TaxID=2072418 RepID=A0A855X7X4_9BACT|nr:MAG: hypothetical protein C3F09_00530 [candidate division GN15 bacterium]